MMRTYSRSPDGFTLVELSIVLVIIGLIVGGIVGGQSLIHSARVQNVTRDIAQHTTSLRAFDLQYDALPGDMIDALNYWPVSGIFNGDGDRKIPADTVLEAYQLWKHLEKAELVEGTYTGSYGANPIRQNPGVNVPTSPFKNGGYIFGPLYGKHGFWFAGVANYNNGHLHGPIISAKNARSIDKKLDDGKADSGKVHTLRGTASSPSLPTDSCIKNSAYSFIPDGTYCRMFFFID